MTKVVVQDRGYWLRDEFWRETREAGFEATLVEIKNGNVTTRAMTREDFAARFTGRVANWVKSEHKSVSVFREALAPDRQREVDELYRESLRVGLETVAREFTARTGAQGKVRLPAEASFVVVVHTRAKDGSPQLHSHVAVGDRVRVQGRDKTYATHKRELYQLRKLFSAAVAQHFGHRLLSEFGVRVQKTEHGITLPDVPKSLCQRSSVRTKQINDYIRAHRLKNTPLTRKYAAVVTRRENRDPEIGQAAFRTELARSGFNAESICQRVSLDPSADVNRPATRREIRRVARVAKHLAAGRRYVTRSELLTRALETAATRHPVSRVKLATEAVLGAPNEVGLRRRTNAFGKAVYVSRRSARRWRKIAQKVEHVLTEKTARHQRAQPRPEKSPLDGESASRQSARSADREPGGERTSKRTTDFRRVVENALRYYRVIGAIGRVGIQAAQIAIELYQTWAKPVWRVHGNGHTNTPGSVAQTVRDLKPRSMLDSHKAAITAMLKLNGTLEQKFRYGECVYRQSRKAKFRVPRKSLVVVRDVGRADPNDVAFLLKTAKRAKAKVLFVEQEHSRFALLQMAKAMKPGEHRQFPANEMNR